MERLASAEGSPELGQYADGFVAWLAGPAAGLSACSDTEKPLPEALVAPFRQTPQQRERSRLETVGSGTRFSRAREGVCAGGRYKS